MCLHGKKTTSSAYRISKIPLFLKIINVLGYICAEVSHQYGGHSFYGFVSTTALWITGILLLIYVFRLNSHVPEITLTIFEVAFCAIFVLLYIIAMFWMLIYGSGAAAFFAFFAIFGYGYYGWTKYSPYFERPVIVVMDRNTNNVV